MKLRYIIDIDLFEDEENLNDLEFKFKNELADFVEDSELGYYANKISVKLQDDYCISEEKKKLAKQTPKKLIVVPTYTDSDVPFTTLCPTCKTNIGYEAQHFCKCCFNCGQVFEENSGKIEN